MLPLNKKKKITLINIFLLKRKKNWSHEIDFRIQYAFQNYFNIHFSSFFQRIRKFVETAGSWKQKFEGRNIRTDIKPRCCNSSVIKGTGKLHCQFLWPLVCLCMKELSLKIEMHNKWDASLIKNFTSTFSLWYLNMGLVCVLLWTCSI